MPVISKGKIQLQGIFLKYIALKSWSLGTFKFLGTKLNTFVVRMIQDYAKNYALNPQFNYIWNKKVMKVK